MNREISNEETAAASRIGDSLAMGMVFALVLTVVQRIVGFGRGLLFCRMMPEEELGQWSLVYSFVLMLAPLAMLGLPGSFCRYVEYYRNRGGLGAFLRRVTQVSFASAIGFCVILVFLPGPFGWIFFRDSAQVGLVRLMALGVFTTVAFFFLASLLEALCEVRLVTVMRFVMAISFAVISLGLAAWWENGILAVTLGFAISNVLGAAPGIWYLWRNQKTLFHSPGSVHLTEEVKPGLWQKVVPFAAWLWLTNFVTNTYEMADRTMLLHFSQVDQQQAQAMVGQYHSGRVLPLVLVGIAVVLGGFLLPYMSRRWEAGEQEAAKSQVRTAAKLVGLGFTFAGLLMLLSAPLIFDSVLEGRYGDGQSVLPMTLVYCVWYSLLLIVIDYLWCIEKGKFAVVLVSAGLVVNIVVNMIAIPKLGLAGAVLATAISNLMTLVAVIFCNQRLGWRADWGVWCCLLLPLVLLLPVWSGALIMSLTAILISRGTWFFDVDEKTLARELIEQGLSRFRRRRILGGS